ncbi:MAG: aminoglycoside phosphotransferase family protein [Actinobacteria bacterium]|nr:MAG: aminoglycoside phosphotransferase family protein [Actinomycetota bacterium]
MHADELPVDVALARALLEDQFPEWADLQLERVASFGTDNALFRLGGDMVVRLPRIEWATRDIEKDARWLEQLRPLLPVEIPQLLATGTPGEGYPWTWGIYRWLDGENPVVGAIARPKELARDIGRFAAAVRRLRLRDTRPGSRAGPLLERDAEVRRAIGEVADEFDALAVEAKWDDSLEAAPWDGPPVWTHGDLLRGNLLLREGRLAAVIDWSLLGVGDPACDAIVAWSVLPEETRADFRRQAGFDEAAWARGRGWALCCGLLQIPYYTDTNPELADNGRHIVREILRETNIRS